MDMRKLTRRGPPDSLTRRMAAVLIAAAITLSASAAAFAADAIVLRVGDQKGGNRSLLEISGLAKDLPYKIEWAEFTTIHPAERFALQVVVPRSKIEKGGQVDFFACDALVEGDSRRPQKIRRSSSTTKTITRLKINWAQAAAIPGLAAG